MATEAQLNCRYRGCPYFLNTVTTTSFLPGPTSCPIQSSVFQGRSSTPSSSHLSHTLRCPSALTLAGELSCCHLRSRVVSAGAGLFLQCVPFERQLHQSRQQQGAKEFLLDTVHSLPSQLPTCGDVWANIGHEARLWWISHRAINTGSALRQSKAPSGPDRLLLAESWCSG